MKMKLSAPAHLLMISAVILIFMVCFTATALGMQVFVYNPAAEAGRTHLTYEVEPGETIESLKAKIQDKDGVLVIDQQLSFAGKTLANDHTLADYNISKDSTLTLSLNTADYSAVDAAIARASALDRSGYSNFAAVDTAIAAVTRGKLLSSQADVDAMAAAVNDAIDALIPVHDAAPSDHSGQPAVSSKAAGTTVSSPATGDASDIAFWAGMGTIALFGMIAIDAARRRTENI
jgi:prophage tail gpP-like protein